MEKMYKQVEGHPNLVRDSKSHAIINCNVDAYGQAKRRVAAAQRQRDEIRDTTREINYIKSEMHEIKGLLKKLLVNNS
mgnify:FL=1